ncbi:PASTA domain-containing protein [Chitinophaga horti]|uniref:PASTA domain-containing protein n=1 Tax=Chitinophaga horti TaxID=2920382 RepID=A0ABY6IY84_9BACT|nr:PASTA domain-containing protein [Chitinophaga horti]UYQ91106.1 PASTA domain-containing protein [Chitinophaga horti]
MFEKITKKPFWFNLLVAIGLVLLLAVIFFMSLGVITRHGDTLQVPDVRGKSIEDATAALEDAGFEVDVRDSVYIDSIPALTVWEQTPERGDVVKVGRTVYLTVRKIVPPMVAMPDLEGLTFRSAEMNLRSRRLNVGDTVYRPDFAANTVLEQLLDGKPVKPGDMVPEGSNISLVLSSGTGNVENPVPELIGLTFIEAKAVLSGTNLVLGTMFMDGPVADTSNAYVIKQTPSARNEFGDRNLIRAGEVIDLVLSATPPAPAENTVVPENE